MRPEELVTPHDLFVFSICLASLAIDCRSARHTSVRGEVPVLLKGPHEDVVRVREIR